MPHLPNINERKSRFRKEIRLKEKNVVNSFLTNNDDYDVEKVLDFIGGEAETKKKIGKK